MDRKKSDTRYTLRHDLKRNAKRREFKFYMDNDMEAAVYDALSSAQDNRQGGAKGLVIDAVIYYLNNQQK